MNAVTLVVQFVLLAISGLLALLLFIMMRQIGILRHRIPPDQKLSDMGLAVGTQLPAIEFTPYDNATKATIPLAGDGVSFLLFSAFSCSKCQTLLEQLPGLPQVYSDRLGLMLLDTDISERYAAQLLTLKRFLVVEAFDLATPFKIQHTPFMYVVDQKGMILEKAGIFTADDILEITARYKLERSAEYAT
jgi:hypothetical protein